MLMLYPRAKQRANENMMKKMFNVIFFNEKKKDFK
jgi:hypothetical protein